MNRGKRWARDIGGMTSAVRQPNRTTESAESEGIGLNLGGTVARAAGMVGWSFGLWALCLKAGCDRVAGAGPNELVKEILHSDTC